eukprot:GILK01003031.1.p1 GENE.GILK01003031.1~~GILK01003031.1.p1  ORF type:complete len:599 (+),score=151.13 GILK01003031.1:265-1797(+)
MAQGSGKDGRPDLPGEHGFRFFPGFYQHIPDTMSRIPFKQGKTVQDNMDHGDFLGMFAMDADAAMVPSHFPKFNGFFDYLKHVFSFLNVANLPKNEVEFFMNRLFIMGSSCEDRWTEEYETIPYWEFMRASELSNQTVRYLVQSATKFLLACKAEKASLRTVGRTFMRLLYNMFYPGKYMDNVLNGPTTLQWINPWVDYLKSKGVTFVRKTALKQIVLSADKKKVLKAVAVNQDSMQSVDIFADYFVSGLPAEKMATVMDEDLKAAAPSMANIDKLLVEWMNGVQFFMKSDHQLVRGHLGLMDSRWALTAVSQAQFWPDFELTQYGDGTVRGIISVDISDFNSPGEVNGPSKGKPAKECTRQELIDEIWYQLSLHKGLESVFTADKSNLHSVHLDNDISFGTNGLVHDNYEPLLVNTVNSWQNRPEASTEIDNLFLASDYVRTTTDIACMEAAVEAGRRAANGVLKQAGMSDNVKIFPEIFPNQLFALKKLDCLRMKAGKKPIGWDHTPY